MIFQLWVVFVFGLLQFSGHAKIWHSVCSVLLYLSFCWFYIWFIQGRAYLKHAWYHQLIKFSNVGTHKCIKWVVVDCAMGSFWLKIFSVYFYLSSLMMDCFLESFSTIDKRVAVLIQRCHDELEKQGFDRWVCHSMVSNDWSLRYKIILKTTHPWPNRDHSMRSFYFKKPIPLY